MLLTHCQIKTQPQPLSHKGILGETFCYSVDNDYKHKSFLSFSGQRKMCMVCFSCRWHPAQPFQPLALPEPKTQPTHSCSQSSEINEHDHRHSIRRICSPLRIFKVAKHLKCQREFRRKYRRIWMSAGVAHLHCAEVWAGCVIFTAVCSNDFKCLKSFLQVDVGLITSYLNKTE